MYINEYVRKLRNVREKKNSKIDNILPIFFRFVPIRIRIQISLLRSYKSRAYPLVFLTRTTCCEFDIVYWIVSRLFDFNRQPTATDFWLRHGLCEYIHEYYKKKKLKKYNSSYWNSYFIYYRFRQIFINGRYAKKKNRTNRITRRNNITIVKKRRSG